MWRKHERCANDRRGAFLVRDVGRMERSTDCRQEAVLGLAAGFSVSFNHFVQVRDFHEAKTRPAHVCRIEDQAV